MKKGILAIGILTITLILTSNAGFCKTVNNYYTVQPPKIQHNHPVVIHKQQPANVKYNQPFINQRQQVPYYSAYSYQNPQIYPVYRNNPPKYNYKTNKKLAKKHSKYKYSNNYNYNNVRVGNNYNYQPSLWERIFNL